MVIHLSLLFLQEWVIVLLKINMFDILLSRVTHHCILEKCAAIIWWEVNSDRKQS